MGSIFILYVSTKSLSLFTATINSYNHTSHPTFTAMEQHKGGPVNRLRPVSKQTSYPDPLPDFILWLWRKVQTPCCSRGGVEKSRGETSSPLFSTDVRYSAFPSWL